jgi:hypothetical protein
VSTPNLNDPLNSKTTSTEASSPSPSLKGWRRPRLKFLPVLLLKCPYCGRSRLRKPGCFIEFAEGCVPCNYKYTREIGYFAGAAQMLNYGFAAVTAMVGGAFMVWKYSDAGDFVVAGIPAAFAGILSFLFIPWGRALWLWMDHATHPLNDDDKLAP